MIKHEPDRPKNKQWVLYTHDGSKVLGTHPSEAKALAQERAVEVAKHSRAAGGPGSGFFGHGGRPGEVGGSSSEGAPSSAATDPKKQVGSAEDRYKEWANSLSFNKKATMVGAPGIGKEPYRVDRGKDGYAVSLAGKTVGKVKSPKDAVDLIYAHSINEDKIRKLSRQLSASTGLARHVTVDGRPTTVVPVVALLEGVIHARNSPQREFVSADVLADSAPEWEGRPLVFNHPQMSGKRLSATDPSGNAAVFGVVRNPRMKDKKLAFDAYIDDEKAKIVGADGIVEKALSGTPMEVSVGVYTNLDQTGGVHAGKSYGARWSKIYPDHFAVLPVGIPGACSVEMGCGLARAASAVPIKKEEKAMAKKMLSRDAVAKICPRCAEKMEEKNLSAVSLDRLVRSPRFLAAVGRIDGEGTVEEKVGRVLRGETEAASSSLTDRVLDAVRSAVSGVMRQAAEPTGPSDDELRTLIQDALYQEMEGDDVSVWVNQLWEQDGVCVYCVTPVGGGESTYFRRSYTVDADGNATLGDDAEEVKQHVDYVPVVNPQPEQPEQPDQMDSRMAGGPGSGYFGHDGRPGEVGGSSSKEGGSEKDSGTTNITPKEQQHIKEKVAEYVASIRKIPQRDFFEEKPYLEFRLKQSEPGYETAEIQAQLDAWEKVAKKRFRKLSSQEGRAASAGTGDDDSPEEDGALDDEDDNDVDDDNQEDEGMTQEELDAAVQTKIDAVKAEAKVDAQKQVEEVRAASAKENAELRAEVEKMRPIVAEHEARAASRKAELVAELKTCSAFDEKALEVMPVEFLEGIKKTVEKNKASVDFSGRGTPRAAASSGIPAAPSVFAKSN